MKMDVGKFITFVFEHKCLWDQSDPKYHLREYQRGAWRELSEEMNVSVGELKKKWRGLRDTFGKELRKHYRTSGEADTEPDSKWPYFKPLLFLRSSMTRRELISNVPVTCEISDGEDSVNASTSSNYTMPFDQSSELSDEQAPKQMFKSPLKKKIKRRQIEEIDTNFNDPVPIQSANDSAPIQSANDPDAQFLMSLLPFLKDIPKHRKLMVRAKLQQVLIDEQNDISSSVTKEGT